MNIIWQSDVLHITPIKKIPGSIFRCSRFTLELQRNFLSLGSATARPSLLLLKELSLFRCNLEHLINVILMQLAISQFTNRY